MAYSDGKQPPKYTFPFSSLKNRTDEVQNSRSQKVRHTQASFN